MASAPVRFENVSKRFRRGQVHDSLRDLFGSILARVTGGRPAGESASFFWALRDVSFEVRRGEALGIIGPNGAGKSTALKLLAGILRPEAGRIHVDGRLSALIEISAGLHGDLTGLENIYLNGAILGMTRREIRDKLDAIVEFSGLVDFLNTPVKRYSTGMQARLGFSVAAHVDPDVLLVDEVLSVGDIAFRQRCDARMRDLVRRGVTLVFVTHNLEQMRSICHRTAVLDQGRLMFVGDPAEASERYLRKALRQAGERLYADCPHAAETTGEVLGYRLLDREQQEVGLIRCDEPVTIEIDFRLDRPVPRLSVETTIRSATGRLDVNFNSAREQRWFDAPIGVGRVHVQLPSLPFAGGMYLAAVRMWDADRCEVVAESPGRYSFAVEDRGRPTGVLALPSTWSDRVETVAPAAANPADSATSRVRVGA
jgi:lipopolysaccharide transport system ATP-binding protein